MILKIKALRLTLSFQQVADIAALIDVSQHEMSETDREKFEVIKVKCIKLLFDQKTDLDKKLKKATNGRYH